LLVKPFFSLVECLLISIMENLPSTPSLQLALRGAKGVLCQLFQLRNQFLAGNVCDSLVKIDKIDP
jgi:hypothetical protein